MSALPYIVPLLPAAVKLYAPKNRTGTKGEKQRSQPYVRGDRIEWLRRIRIATEEIEERNQCTHETALRKRASEMRQMSDTAEKKEYEVNQMADIVRSHESKEKRP